MMSFTWVDWVVIAIITASAFISLTRGVVKELISLLTWSAAAFLALSFGEHLAFYLDGYIDSPSLQTVVSYSLIIIVTLAVGAVINRLVAALVKATGTSGSDRILGVIFGCLKGALIVAALSGLLGVEPIEQAKAWKNSVLLPHFIALGDWSKQTAKSVVEPVLNYDSNFNHSN